MNMNSSDFYILPQISALSSISACFVLSILYVSSLYVWSSEHNRDHPSTIKKRFFSVTVVMLISPIFVYLFSADRIFDNVSLFDALGFRLKGIVPAFILPLILTAILFLGPLSQQWNNGVFKEFVNPLPHFSNVLWLRNHIVAPLSEEFTFRACMLPLLLQTFKPSTAVLITPLFFGVAHFHHMAERLRAGMEKKTVIIVSCFQFTYTTIFGMYSAYLFAKTGHFVAPFIAHAFCNHMGFPDFVDVFNKKDEKKFILISLYVLGLVSWIILLPILTNPNLYENNLLWKYS